MSWCVSKVSWTLDFHVANLVSIQGILYDPKSTKEKFLSEEPAITPELHQLWCRNKQNYQGVYLQFTNLVLPLHVHFQCTNNHLPQSTGSFQ